MLTSPRNGTTSKEHLYQRVPAMSTPSLDGIDERLRLARRWAQTVAPTAYVPMSRAEVEQYLADLVTSMVDGLLASRLDGQRNAARPEFECVGERLVQAHLTGPTSLQRTIQLLGTELPAHPELCGVDGINGKVLEMLGALSAGYARALREQTFDQQEGVKQALLRSRQIAERNLEVSEARFRGVFTSAAVGIAITDLAGSFVEVNSALGEILGYPADELAGRTLYDLMVPEDAPQLRIAYRDVARAEVDADSFRLQRRMIRYDGEISHVFLAGSVLLDATGAPAYHVAMVEDVSDLQLLQERLSHQALHDVQTGLPNRHFFHTTLERVLGQLQPTEVVTLFHLDIDGFSVINSGLGHQVGDQLLQVVTKRLIDVFANERATIARIAGDEFVVLVENGPDTPDVPTLAARINDELAEPAYVGDTGIAVSVTIGVVQRQVRGLTVQELVRKADATLHRAKANGKRQWALYDDRLDAENRGRFALAAGMPGALENGEFQIVYQPQVRLGDRSVVSVEAMLEWDHPERGLLPHEQCIELAERTGMVLPIGQWMLRSAAEQLADWRAVHGESFPSLSIHLSSAQANDPDLVRNVRTVLVDTALPPSSLQVGIPVRALLCEDGDADENLEVLADMGVSVTLVGFGAGHGGLAFVEDQPVRTVKMAAWLVTRLANQPDSLTARAVADLTRHVSGSGTSIIVPSIRSAEQASWWQTRGADLGQGPLFATPVAAPDIPALVQPRPTT